MVVTEARIADVFARPAFDNLMQATYYSGTQGPAALVEINLFKERSPMRRISTSVACLFVILFLTVSAISQMPMPKPAPELSKLEYFAGNWISDADLKPSPMGPGGKMTSSDDVHWMEGKFFLVLHSKFKGAMGDGSSLSIMGYDPEHKVYTYTEYNSMGQVEHSTGTLDGNTWTFTSDENFNGQMMKGRFTMNTASPKEYTYKYEMSKDGTDWTTIMEGKSTKK